MLTGEFKTTFVIAVMVGLILIYPEPLPGAQIRDGACEPYVSFASFEQGFQVSVNFSLGFHGQLTWVSADSGWKNISAGHFSLLVGLGAIEEELQ